MSITISHTQRFRILTVLAVCALFFLAVTTFSKSDNVHIKNVEKNEKIEQVKNENSVEFDTSVQESQEKGVIQHPKRPLPNYPNSIFLLSEALNRDAWTVTIEEKDDNKLFPCEDDVPSTVGTSLTQRGNYWALINFIRAQKYFSCHQSLTYTTHSEFTYLRENLPALLSRWNGPISLSIYAPGTDFEDSLREVLWLRECFNEKENIRDYVTFHFFSDKLHPIGKELEDMILSNTFNCTFLNRSESKETYRKQNKIPYPINVGRNIAKQASTTKYLLPSDIELYPNPGLIPNFLKMIGRIRNKTGPETKNVIYVLPIFEVDGSLEIAEMPQDKEELVAMLDSKIAVPFHYKVCSYCHKIPKADEWKDSPVIEGLRVFTVANRTGEFKNWEPIYIGTKKEPSYDERLSWDGLRDKMTQGYTLCVLGYDMHILDNAFLVHHPGIKTRAPTADEHRKALIWAQNEAIKKFILPELKLLYGDKEGCVV